MDRAEHGPEQGHVPTVVAVIPARAGSKGVPGKNIRPVGGVPLVARAVASARAAALIDEVAVTTDGPDIAEVARAAGAIVVDRPAEIAGDTASSESALLHALDVLEADGLPADVLVFIQATSPFIDPTDLDAAVQRVLDGESDVVLAAAETHSFLWRQTDAGAAAINHDSSFRPRRQDREAQYVETGAFYVMRVDGFREAGFRFFGRVDLAVTDESHSVEIDTPADLALADAIARSEPS
ncbi:MAG: acylneuraminate cytidylyltransferase family protein [Microbacteriaceae bacterium]|nr:acylneuraminate cytidylyltransferase family protein [Microbacteriaceae bacterium]MCL2795666.1 acylneuraminate cytidylyltransferase family protein [Microbacteriaceae bacterium]